MELVTTELRADAETRGAAIASLESTLLAIEKSVERKGAISPLAGK